MPTIIKTEYKSALDALTMAYRLITVDKKRAKLYKEAGNWYVETIDTNVNKGSTK
jgi:hypothetical protein